MDEFTAVLKAREFVAAVAPTTAPVPLDAYLRYLGSKLHIEDDMGVEEDGNSFDENGRHHICVNGKHRNERRRFTICHEIAHKVLGLASEHHSGPDWSYTRKSPNEVLCDVFAAEILLPYRLFKPHVDKATISFAAIEDLSGMFEASLTATGSRFAVLAAPPCAFVLSEKGKVRYSSRSTSLRNAGAWITLGAPLPDGCLAARIRGGNSYDGAEEVAADLWFSGWERGGALLEDARCLTSWDQTLSLLWFEDEDVPPQWRSSREEEEEVGLKELDGVLPWPDKSRRRR